jgi:hypothetical protein
MGTPVVSIPSERRDTGPDDERFHATREGSAHDVEDCCMSRRNREGHVLGRCEDERFITKGGVSVSQKYP